MFGKIELAKQEGLTKMPQMAASAWSAIGGLIGASYKPLVYVGSQQVRGINHWFIAEQTLVTENPERRIVILAINEFLGQFAVVPNSFDVIIS